MIAHEIFSICVSALWHHPSKECRYVGRNSDTKEIGTCVLKSSSTLLTVYFGRSKLAMQVFLKEVQPSFFLQLMPSVKMGFGLCTHLTQHTLPSLLHKTLCWLGGHNDWIGQGDIAFKLSLTLNCPIFPCLLVWLVPLAQVLPHPQLIFPSKTWFFLGNLFEFSVSEITLKSISPTFWIQIFPNKFH